MVYSIIERHPTVGVQRILTNFRVPSLSKRLNEYQRHYPIMHDFGSIRSRNPAGTFMRYENTPKNTPKTNMIV